MACPHLCISLPKLQPPVHDFVLDRSNQPSMANEERRLEVPSLPSLWTKNESDRREEAQIRGYMMFTVSNESGWFESGRESRFAKNQWLSSLRLGWYADAQV